ncbi:MAG: hypothetical protein IJ039_04510 [Clostridia bacterium]|nr:hypothetical protein [Clostridia bacterium]
MKKKILCVVFAMLVLLSVFPLSVFATSTNAESSDFGYMDLSQTEIEYDFKYIFAGKYNIEDYGANVKDESLHFLSAMESQGADGKTELYIYIYNPSRKQIVKDTEWDKLSLARYTSPSDDKRNEYSKQDITLVKTHGATSDTDTVTNAVLLKYKLDSTQAIYGSVDRYYRLADIELQISGEANATSFIAGKQYKFFNDSKGYINCTVQDLTTLEMDAFHTFYRVNTDGVDRYTDIQSVYFAVPNKWLEMYGNLYSMNVEWYRYSTNNALVVSNSSVYNLFKSYYLNNKTSNFSYSVLYKQYFPFNDFVYDYYTYGYNLENLSDWVYWDTDHLLNIKGEETGKVGYQWSDAGWAQLIPDTVAPKASKYDLPLSMVFYSNNIEGYETKALEGKEILAYIESENWDSSLFDGSREYVKKEFTVEMNDSLGVYEMCTGWEKFWHGNVYEKSTGEMVTFERFQQVDLNDLEKMSIEEFSQYYKIDEYDVECTEGDCGECFSCQTKKDLYKDCTWFFLRYDTTNYQSYDSNVINNGSGNEKVCNSFMFNTDVVRNFDTIDIGFKNVDENGVETITVFPIGRSPTNFVADAWTPSEKPVIDLGDILDPWAEFFEKLEKILTIILCVALFIIVVRIISFFAPLFKVFKKKNKAKKSNSGKEKQKK